MVTTTKKINLGQLETELNAGGLKMVSIDGSHTITPLNDTIIKSQLETAVAAHSAIDNPETTVTEKLAFVGLSVDDLKAALGL